MSPSRAATTRDIEFTTTEGTWMSVDLAPNGQWLVFDLLGHIYRLPAAGGTATSLTQSSGIAINSHPRISPDGSLIAFISDRKGQSNLWVMNADGSNPRAVFTDNYVRAVTPAWTADGQYIVVQRSQLPNGGQPGGGGIWMYHKDGGSGIELLSSRKQPASWPSLSRDGRYLYFQVTNQGASLAGYSGRADFLNGAVQVRRMDMLQRRDLQRLLRRTDAAGASVERRDGGARGLARRQVARLRAAHSRRDHHLEGTHLRPALRALAAQPRDR